MLVSSGRRHSSSSSTAGLRGSRRYKLCKHDECYRNMLRSKGQTPAVALATAEVIRCRPETQHRDPMCQLPLLLMNAACYKFLIHV